MSVQPVGPEYEPLGPWWTYDAPSVRVADAQHNYVSIWSTGDSGPSVLLVAPASRDHRVWEPMLPQLVEHFVVHALDLRAATITDTDSIVGTDSDPTDVQGVVTALAAVGARLVAAAGDASAAALQALRLGAASRVVLWDPPPDVAPALRAFVAGGSPSVRVFTDSPHLEAALADTSVVVTATPDDLEMSGPELAGALLAAQSTR